MSENECRGVLQAALSLRLLDTPEIAVSPLDSSTNQGLISFFRRYLTVFKEQGEPKKSPLTSVPMYPILVDDAHIYRVALIILLKARAKASG